MGPRLREDNRVRGDAYLVEESLNAQNSPSQALSHSRLQRFPFRTPTVNLPAVYFEAVRDKSMKTSARIALIAAISLLTVGCDQVTKVLAAEYLPRGEVYSFLFDTVRIGYAENRGAFLGLGSNLSPELRFSLFVVMVGVFLLGLVAYMLASRQLNRASIAGLSLLFAGGLSNFYDRLFNNGAVIDFINMGLGPLRTGIFNIADMAILLGLVIVIFSRPRETPPA
ncbi:signal peptidase II [Marinimicrobium sp. ABcell2]|uniref:signal peptidase II n=1 Tax=Marinimicrobium sp. ABcell2 TaxID=3069751 RepID=UPI0027B29E9B|nr:signal peptidase II [Marinimicrobium sp. ABcell2]MDQ2076074.1 signal peptidase II [Marinimicrobium sp. ABcell2]